MGVNGILFVVLKALQYIYKVQQERVSPETVLLLLMKTKTSDSVGLGIR